jgi:hypothetical protein
MQTIENKQGIEFLLGWMSEQKREQLEEKFVTDKQTFEELLQAENDLIDDYVRLRLSSEDSERFEALFLPRLNDRVCFARALAKFANANAYQVPVPLVGWTNSVRQFFSLSPGFAVALTAALVVLMIVLGTLLNRGPVKEIAVTNPDPLPAASELPVPLNSPTPTQSTFGPLPTPTPLKEVKPQSTPATSLRSVIATIVLTPGLTRGSGTAVVVDLPAKDGLVKLSLPPEEGDFRRYALTVETIEGHKVWQQRVPARSGSISTNIPRKRLSRGDYIVTLKGIGPDGIADVLNEYTFSIKN